MSASATQGGQKQMESAGSACSWCFQPQCVQGVFKQNKGNKDRILHGLIRWALVRPHKVSNNVSCIRLHCDWVSAWSTSEWLRASTVDVFPTLLDIISYWTFLPWTYLPRPFFHERFYRGHYFQNRDDSLKGATGIVWTKRTPGFATGACRLTSLWTWYFGEVACL